MPLHPITSWASILALIAIAVSIVRIGLHLRRGTPRARRMTPRPCQTRESPPAEVIGLVPTRPYLRVVVDNTSSTRAPYDQERDAEWVELRRESVP